MYERRRVREAHQVMLHLHERLAVVVRHIHAAGRVLRDHRPDVARQHHHRPTAGPDPVDEQSQVGVVEHNLRRHTSTDGNWSYAVSVFQLGLFMRALRPARTGLRPARFTSALPEWYLKKKKIKLLLCFQTADVKMLVLADLCPCFHQSPTKLCPDLVSFACWIVTEFWSFMRKSVPHLVIRTLNCARFCGVCALNCARILVSCLRARLCPIYVAPCPFPNLAGTLSLLHGTIWLCL